jgi:hypothetical protein
MGRAAVVRHRGEHPVQLIQRVQDILLRPKETWPAIAAESADTGSIYKEYLVYLAAIPAVAGFVGLSMLGAGVGLASMIVSYVLSLVLIYVMSLIVDKLAPTFKGISSPINALKLMAYGSTASFVGGIFAIVPALSVLGLLASLYSVYLIYTGLPVLMQCPPDKAAVFTAVIVLSGFVASLLLAAVLSVFTPAPVTTVGSAPAGPSTAAVPAAAAPGAPGAGWQAQARHAPRGVLAPLGA